MGTRPEFKVKTSFKRMLADTVTPVNIYLRLREAFPKTFLLESADYKGNDNSFSYICCNPKAEIILSEGLISESFPDGQSSKTEVTKELAVPEFIDSFAKCFIEDSEVSFPFISNGLFGYTSFEAVQCFEDIEFSKDKDKSCAIPDIQYAAFEFVIAINHFKNELYIFQHQYADESSEFSIEDIASIINKRDLADLSFSTQGSEESNLTDQEFLDIVAKCKGHIQRGDVFQVVPSRRFSRKFSGDDFNVYRALRSINPSPYLFYFDYGDFKIFGSSPEAQLVIQENKATINPIAGTVHRSGDEAKDMESAKALQEDPKENAEHVMLVDLARNDLSKHCDDVGVETYREIHFYSHVIHLVSKVSGAMREEATAPRIVADTFPAGTLSGAPKHRAMQIIDDCEPSQRNFYAGCIGFYGFNGDYNHAIIIRSFLSKDNTLYYQAGAGLVSDSQPEKELNEVNIKLAALKSAIQMAEEL